MVYNYQILIKTKQTNLLVPLLKFIRNKNNFHNNKEKYNYVFRVSYFWNFGTENLFHQQIFFVYGKISILL